MNSHNIDFHRVTITGIDVNAATAGSYLVILFMEKNPQNTTARGGSSFTVLLNGTSFIYR